MFKRSTLIALFSVALLALPLFGCGGPSDEQLIRENLEGVLSSYDIDNEQFASIAQTVEDEFLDQLGVSADDFWALYFEDYSYETGEVSIEGDSAQVQVSITVKSIGDMMLSYQDAQSEWQSSVDPNTITSEEDLYHQAGQILLESMRNTEPVQRELTIKYTKTDNGWVMDYSSQSDLNSLFGA